MSFEALCNLTTVAAFLLGFGWLFAGPLMIKRWEREPNEVALVVGRRLGVVYGSVGIFCFSVHGTQSPDLIHAVSAFAVVVNAALATVGTFEMMKRRVGKAMAVSIAVEILLAMGFGRLLLIT